jgi:hypothetical protein
MRQSPFFMLLVSLLLAGLTCRRATAGEVVISWQPEPSAMSYELEVRRNEQVVFQKSFPSGGHDWRGTLPYGSYVYRLRTFDRAERAGPWSDPISFLVSPPPPRLIVPLDYSTVLWQPSESLSFRWTEIPDATRFILTVKGKSGTIERSVQGTEATLQGLGEGEYAWRVQPVLERSGNGEGAAQGTGTKASAISHFRLATVKDEEQFAGDFQKIRLLVPKKSAALNPEDYVCLLPQDAPRSVPIGCGKVLSRSEDSLEVSLLAQRGRLTKGSRFYLSAPAASRTPSSLSRSDDAYLVTDERARFVVNLGIGLSAGTNYFYPVIEAQVAVFPGSVLGLRALYSDDSPSATSDIKLLGGLLTWDQYFGRKNYNGIFAELGLGPYVFSAHDTSGSQPGRVALTGEASLGWRFRPAQQGFNVALSAGAQYISAPKISVVSSTLQGWVPLLTMLFGYSF